MDVVDYRNATSGVTVDLRLSTAQDTGFGTSRLLNIEGINGSDFDDVITGNSGDNQFEGRGGNDTFNIGSGGHDTLLYKLINATDATGGNGHDVVNGFTVGTWEGTADTDRIDLRDLLSGSGYTGTGSASYVNGVATLDSSAGNISDYIRVVQNGSNTEIGWTGRDGRPVLANRPGDAERRADGSGDAAGEPSAVNCVKQRRGERSSRLFAFLYMNSHNPIFHKIILRARLDKVRFLIISQRYHFSAKLSP